MNSANLQLFLPLFFFSLLATFQFHEAPFRALGQQTEETQKVLGRRVLLSFKEKPAGSNLTFDCAPSGPCVPCLYSEKGDEKYRCSETGYRIPFKCEEIKDSMKDTKTTNSQKARSSLEISDSVGEPREVSHVAKEFTASTHRTLLDDSLTSDSDNNSQAYITYRSCIPPATEELSVLSFEGVVVFLLMVSGSIIYVKKKKAVSVSGFAGGRAQTNSRF